MTLKRCSLVCVAVGAVALVGQGVRADPPDNYVLKFQQRPQGVPSPIPYRDTNGSPTTPPTPGEGEYYGHDELSTLIPFVDSDGQVRWEGTAMADDFADPFETPVLHVRWWGSYLGNNDRDFAPANRFLIAWETDVPDPGDPHDHGDGFSHPGTVLQWEVVSEIPGATGPPPPGTFTERAVSSGGPNPDGISETIYEYNAELALPFEQEPDTVYWLKIAALVGQEQDDFDWGWHNRDYTIMDTLASVVPFPGEHNDGPWDWDLDGPDVDDKDIWHFQDDAVSALTLFDPNDPIGVIQDNYTPQFYVDRLDGPEGISRFSKDLAFELFTVEIPAPAAIWGGLALLGLLGMKRRRTARRSGM